MKILKKISPAVVLVVVVASSLLMNGCGRKEAVAEGCPSDTYEANATDTMTGPADIAFTGSSGVGSLFPGGSILISPLTYTVLDASGDPRNKVCITLYTGGTTGTGFWYADSNYATVVAGSGAFNKIIAVTDTQGRATLYWSSETLPAANPRNPVLPLANPPTFTAGADQTGTSFVKAYSGTLSTIFNFNWTVKGEPAL